MKIRDLLKPIYTARIVEITVAGIAVGTVRRRIGAVGRRSSSIAILFPTDRGSVGDEAMAIALVSQLRRQGCNRIGLISFSAADDWSDLKIFDEVRCRPTGWPLRWFGFSRWLARYDALGVIGADVLDGHYSSVRSRARLFLAQFSRRLGLNTVLLGFSYRANPEANSLRMLRNCAEGVAVLCRDPRSLKRVQSLAGLPAIQVADLAFLLTPDAQSTRVAKLIEWVELRKADGARVIGVNCNRQASVGWSPAEAGQLVDAYTIALSTFANNHPKVHFIMVPHDSRGEFSDEILGRRIFNSLSREFRERSFLVSEVWTAPEIKAIAGKLDAAITGRMHFAIACLGSGTPVASFEYQDKFAGMYDLFNLSDLCVPGQLSNSSESIVALLELLWEQADVLRSKIEAKLPEIMELSYRNVVELIGGAPRQAGSSIHSTLK